jgi:hypothetical protein
MMPASSPSVGLFWRIPGTQGLFRLVFAAAGLSEAERYGGCLTDRRGHYELWEHWNSLSPRELKALGVPLEVKTQLYEHWPRGRVVYEIAHARFVIYADHQLHSPETISTIIDAFCLRGQGLTVRGDGHYRT